MKRSILTVLTMASLVFTAAAKPKEAPADTKTPAAADTKKTEAPKAEKEKLQGFNYSVLKKEKYDEKTNSIKYSDKLLKITSDTEVTLGADKKPGTPADVKVGTKVSGSFNTATNEIKKINVIALEEKAAPKETPKKDDKKPATDKPKTK